MITNPRKETDFLVIVAVYCIWNLDAAGRQRFSFRVFHIMCCRSAFLVAYGISERVFKNIVKHLSKSGVKPRIHGNVGNEHRKFDISVRQRAGKFLERFAEMYGLPDPGHIRSPKTDKPLTLLPSRMTKFSIYLSYCHFVKKVERTAMSLTLFYALWKRNFDHIKSCSPSTDLCLKCVEYGQRIFKAPTKNARLELTAEWKAHLDIVAARRQEYTKRMEDGKSTAINMGIRYEEIFLPNPPCSRKCTLCYDFDFAANMFLPHHAAQEGPIYFMTPKKVYIFGVAASFTWSLCF